MEHIENFNEHQKRKFKSFQTEKQAERDKVEEEERKKSWGSTTYYGGGSGTYGRGASYYDNPENWPSSWSRESAKKKIISTQIGGEWRDPHTWIGNIVPSPTDDVIINGFVTLDNSISYRSCHDLTINAAKALIVRPTVVLNITGDFTNNGKLTLEDGKEANGKANYTSVIVTGVYISGFGGTLKTGTYTIFKTKNQTITKGISNKSSDSTIVKPAGLVSTNGSPISTKSDPSESKQKLEHSYAIGDLFPDVNIDKLPEIAVFIGTLQKDLLNGKEYDVLPNARNIPDGFITVRNEKGIIYAYKSFWFRRYRKYNFRAFVTPLDMYADTVVGDKKTKAHGYALTKGKNYKIIGESSIVSDCKYEITDDNHERKSYSKLMFSLPFKMEGTPGDIKKVLSNTEIEKTCSTWGGSKKENEPKNITPPSEPTKTNLEGRALGVPNPNPQQKKGWDRIKDFLGD